MWGNVADGLRKPTVYRRRICCFMATALFMIGWPLLVASPPALAQGDQSTNSTIGIGDETGSDPVVAITVGGTSPSPRTAEDYTTTPLQATVDYTPAGSNGPHWAWNVDSAEYSTDGQTWSTAITDDYTTAFPDGDKATTTFQKPGYWRFTVSATALFPEIQGRVEPLYVSYSTTLNPIYVAPAAGGGGYGEYGGSNPIKVKILWNSSRAVDDANPTTKTMVGYRMRLSYYPGNVPTGTPVTNYRWGVSGICMDRWQATRGSYDPSNPNKTTEGKRVALTRTDQSDVEFVWIDGTYTGTPKTVSFSCLINNKPYSASAKFMVYRPNAIMTITPRDSVVDTAGKPPYQTDTPYLKLGPPFAVTGNSGINFSIHLDMPQVVVWDRIPTGETLPVQVVKGGTLKYNYSTSDIPSNWMVVGRLTSGLDTSYPYLLGVVSGPSFRADDSPTYSLMRAMTERYYGVSVNWSYSMHFLFRPVGAGESDWVPLQKVDWNWIAKATRTGGTWGTPTSTSPVDTNGNLNKPQAVYTTQHPMWNNFSLLVPASN